MTTRQDNTVYAAEIYKFEDGIDAAIAAGDLKTAERLVAERREFRLNRGAKR